MAKSSCWLIGFLLSTAWAFGQRIPADAEYDVTTIGAIENNGRIYAECQLGVRKGTKDSLYSIMFESSEQNHGPFTETIPFFFAETGGVLEGLYKTIMDNLRRQIWGDVKYALPDTRGLTLRFSHERGVSFWQMIWHIEGDKEYYSRVFRGADCKKLFGK